MSKQSKADRNNTANQQNRNNDAYWQSRGLPGRPATGSDVSPPISPVPSSGSDKPK